MREKLIGHDVIECVLGLGPNLFYNSPMEACVVICRTAKPKARKNKVLFINAVNEVTRERAQSFLTDEHINRIVRAYRDFKDIPGFARAVNNDKIREHGNNLSISLYVQTIRNDRVQEAKGDYIASLSDALAAWRKSSHELRKSMKDLFKVLDEPQIRSSRK